MHVASHRSRHLLLALIILSIGLLLLVRPAHGGWSADPVEVHATSALCPLVSVADDGQRGAIVVWQENTASGGLLRARHLLASGDVDPSWSGPVAVSDVDVARFALGTVSDGVGGAYVWWLENTMLMVNRLAPDGSVAAGWLAHGRNVGALPTTDHRPRAMSDGAGGIYLGWVVRDPFTYVAPTSIRVIHLGPAGTGAGGWPTGGRSYGLVGVDNPSVVGFGMDRASDGGLWLGWVTNELYPYGGAGPGEVRAARLAPSGLGASGWTTSGIALGPYPATNFGAITVAQSYVAVAHDDVEGAYLLTASRETPDGSSWYFHDTLRHLSGSGTSFGGWDDAGLDLGARADAGYFADEPGSVRAFADGRGGAYVGIPTYGSEFLFATSYSRIASDGSPLPGGIGADQRGQEFAARGDGGMFIGAFKPSGATGPYEADAYVRIAQSDGAFFYRSQPSAYATRFGDIGLAATGDGGAIFAWSELLDHQGVFAIRLNPAGQVTSVPPTVSPRAFRAWFVRGAGVRVAGGGAGAFSLRLHDITGREVARGESDAVGEWTVPGTAELPSGVYFAKATVAGRTVQARVAVVH